MPKIYILDVTNRDGVQTAHLGLAKIEKTMINFFSTKWEFIRANLGSPPLVMKLTTSTPI